MSKIEAGVSEAALIAMMDRPKTPKMEERINNLVADAGPAGTLTDEIRRVFKAWRNLPIVVAPKAPAVVVQVADLPETARNETFFLAEIMQRQKTNWRKKEIDRRIHALKKAGHMTPELGEAYSMWCGVKIGGFVSKEAEATPEAPESATPAAPVAASGAGDPATDHQPKTGKRRRNKKKRGGPKSGDAKPEQNVQGGQPAPAEKPKQAPAVVLKGTSHPDGEPRHSPFDLLAKLAGVQQGDSVAA